MANIRDYIKWRGDLDFNNSDFNELDNLILAGLSYLNIEKLVTFDEEITLTTLQERITNIAHNKLELRNRFDGIFYPLVFKSDRYKNVHVTGFKKILDPEIGIQFGAITAILPNDTIYVSFRGTSNSLVGWKEDFEMSFLDEVPAQKQSIEYLEKMANKYPDKKIIVGGHSKGGNLAIYSSIFSSDEIQDRIVKIYNNDGPGISKKISQNPNYQKILPKVITYIPQTSIVGRLLVHEEKTQVINSTQKGMWQHDFYTWQLCGTQFIYRQTPDVKSNKIDYSLTDFLEKLTDEQRKEFIDIFFELLEKSNIKTFKDLTQKWYLYIGTLINNYTQLTPEQKDVLIHSFEKLYLASQEANKQVKRQEKKEKQEKKQAEDTRQNVKTNRSVVEKAVNEIKTLLKKI